MNIYRQGDVILIRVDDAEVGAEVPREGERVVLAHGEVTGHAHAIAERDAVLFETKTQQDAALMLGARILKASATVTLRHEEHAPITVPAGTYRVQIQREYAPGALRNVQD